MYKLLYFIFIIRVSYFFFADGHELFYIMCMYMCACVYVYIYMCMYMCLCIYMYVYMCICIYVCICVYMCMCGYVYASVYICDIFIL